MLEIRTLGGLSVGMNGQPIQDLGSRKAEAILVYLVKEGRQLSRNFLKALLWPESSEEHAATSLRVELSVLRKRLGRFLDISREAIGLRPDAQVYFDLADLSARLASNQVERALELYHGDFLLGFHLRDSAEFEEWLRWEQESVRRLVLRALHGLIAESIQTQDHGKGQTLVRQLLELDPMDELAQQHCLRLLALDGQRPAALAHYEKWRATLQRELGVEPLPETQALYEQILHGERPVSPGPALPQHNLPAAQTSFVGRERELARIGELIHDPACRLVTLVGPGGSGKTRLALRAAGQALRCFPDGVYFVPLEACYSADDLVPAIANPLPFSVDTIASELSPKAQLLDYLQSRSLLVVLDGFEHLVDGAGLLSEMLGRAPQVQVLVTSRQRLALKGEWTLAIEGLPVARAPGDAPADEAAAVRLFIERAQQAKPGLQSGEVDLGQAVRICQLVEGMPLGIELAAAWTSLLSPREIADEMDRSLHFLTTPLRDVPEKHRSLQAAFDSSWQLLTEEQRETMGRLAVFRGGFDRQAARLVTGAGLPELSALLERSLLRRGQAGSFSMHGLLQEFAAEKLKLSTCWEQLYHRHSRYYVDLLARGESGLLGAQMLQAREEIGQEIGNVRAAINWASLHWDTRPARRALMSVLIYYTVQGWHEGRDAFRDIARLRREALEASGAPDPGQDPILLSARAHQAFFSANLGQIDESEAISRECLMPLRELAPGEELSECLQNLGVNASFRGELGVAQAYLEEAILLGRDCDHPLWPTYLLWLGHVYFLQGEYEQGRLSFEKSHELFERQGAVWGIAFALSKMGLAADGLGEHAQALRYHQEAFAIFERVGNVVGQAYSLSRMSMSAFFLSDYHQAVELGREGQRIFEDIGHRWGICASLCRLGFATLGLGQSEQARGHFETALRQSSESQILPLSLYALAGLAAVLAEEGKQEQALELFRYVRRHPQTPPPYLEQALRWIGDQERASPGEGDRAAGAEGELETVDAVAARLLG